MTGKQRSFDVVSRLDQEIVWLDQEIDRLDCNREFFARDLICDWAINVLVRAILRREEQLAQMELARTKGLGGYVQ